MYLHGFLAGRYVAHVLGASKPPARFALVSRGDAGDPSVLQVVPDDAEPPPIDRCFAEVAQAEARGVEAVTGVLVSDDHIMVFTPASLHQVVLAIPFDEHGRIAGMNVGHREGTQPDVSELTDAFQEGLAAEAANAADDAADSDQPADDAADHTADAPHGPIAHAPLAERDGQAAGDIAAKLVGIALDMIADGASVSPGGFEWREGPSGKCTLVMFEDDEMAFTWVTRTRSYNPGVVVHHADDARISVYVPCQTGAHQFPVVVHVNYEDEGDQFAWTVECVAAADAGWFGEELVAGLQAGLAAHVASE